MNMANHVVHHQGGPRPDLGIGEAVAGLGAMVVGVFILAAMVAGILANLPVIIGTLLALGLTGAASTIGWRRRQRKKLLLWILKRRLSRCEGIYAVGRSSLETLSAGDRQFADRRLNELRGRQRCLRRA